MVFNTLTSSMNRIKVLVLVFFYCHQVDASFITILLSGMHFLWYKKIYVAVESNTTLITFVK